MTPTQTVTARAVLRFADAAGYTGQISVPRARLDKTTEQARESMAAIIASGALSLRSVEGNITTAKGAKIVRTVRTVLFNA